MKFNFQNNKGFTLIEMVIVIAVIGILMGIAFGGVRNVQGSARDTKRKADMKNVQTYLELYFNKCGHYPGGKVAGTDGCDISTIDGSAKAVTSWNTLQTALQDSGIITTTDKIPSDPIAANYYFYSSSTTDNNNTYTMAAQLERKDKSPFTGATTMGGSTCGSTVSGTTYCVTN